MKILAAVIAIALAAWQPPAMAGASGRVTQGQLSYTLVDLAPEDGIAPSLVFEPLPNPGPVDPVNMAHGSVRYAVGDDSRFVEQAATGTDPLVLGYDLGSAGAITARLDGRGQPATQRLAIEAGANPGEHGDVQVGSWMYVGDMGFTLSANTRVEFSTTLHVQAGVTSAAGANEWFQSASWMYLMMGHFPDTTGFDWDHELVTVHADPAWGAPRDVDTTLTMTVAYDNTALEGQYGTVSFNTSVNAMAAQPVPEPAALSMMFAGLLVLGGTRLRARSRLRC